MSGGVNLDLDAAERARRGAGGILLGTVAEVDPATGLARVQSGALRTGWLPWLAARAGGDRTWSAPDVGEQVVLAAPDGDLARAVILGALYRDASPAPAASQDIHRRTYQDGAVIEYDRASHTLTATLPSGGTVNLTAPGQVTVTAPQVVVTAQTGVTIDTPLLTVTGAISTGSGANGGATIHGDINQVNGSITTDGSITSDGDQIAGANSISQINHLHGGVTPGGGVTAVPQ